MNAETLRKKLMRPASSMIVGGFRPSSDPAASWFGRVNLALPGEAWPMFDGRAILPLCQINVSELPYVPDAIADVALLTLFVNHAIWEWDGRTDGRAIPLPQAENGQGWALRTYSSLEDLVPLEAPEPIPAPTAFPIRWEQVEDYPSRDEWPDITQFEDWSDVFTNVDGSKVGGWPTTLQSNVEWSPPAGRDVNPEYVFQIDSEEKANWMWGFSGVGYFGRGTGSARDIWCLSWQSL